LAAATFKHPHYTYPAIEAFQTANYRLFLPRHPALWKRKNSKARGTNRHFVSALKSAGCEKIFRENASGGRWDRPELHRLLDQLRKGDILVPVGNYGYMDQLAAGGRSYPGDDQ
jgi:hypothetical protein